MKYIFLSLLCIIFTELSAQSLPLIVNSPEKWGNVVCAESPQSFLLVASHPDNKWSVSHITREGILIQSQLFDNPLAENVAFIPKKALFVGENGWVVVGNIPATKSGYDRAVCLKLNPSFELEWVKSFGTEENRVLTDCILTKENDFVFCGTIQGRPEKGKEIWLGRIDTKGELVWEKFYGWEKEEQAQTLIQRNDGTLLVGGSTLSRGAGKRDMMLLSISAAGKLAWARVYGKDLSNEGIESLFETSKDEVLIAGWTDENSTNIHSDGRIIFTDKEGKIIWSNIVGDGGEDKFLSVRQEHEKIWAAGYTLPAGSLGAKGWLIQFDLAGKTLLVQTNEKDYSSYKLLQNTLLAISEEKGMLLPLTDTENAEAQVVDILFNTQTLATLSPLPKTPELSEPPIALATPTPEEQEEPTPSTPPSPPEEIVAETPTEVLDTTNIPHVSLLPYPTQKAEVAADSVPSNPITEVGKTEEKIPEPTLMPTTKAQPEGKGNLFLLSMGISETKKNKDFLPMAATDAKEFSDFWANSNFSSLNKIVPRLFINQTATSSTLKANLLDMQTTSTAADWVCMYIQTKYELSPEGKPFLQMFDTDPMGRESSFISVPALTNMIQLIPGKKWIVLDIFKETPTSEEMLELRKNLVSELSENIDDMIVLIPCLPMEASQDDPSVFMEILLEAMKGMADTDKDRAISMTEIRAYIEKNVPLQTQDQQHPLFIENSPLNFLLLQKNP